MPALLSFAPCLLLVALLVTACQRDDVAPPVSQQTPASSAVAGSDTSPPPSPPLREDFEGEPQLSLFPRVGDYAPEEQDREGQGLWLTYIDHLLRTSRPIKVGDSHGFAFRGLKTIGSVGFFSPLAIEPDADYQVGFRFWSKLPPGASAGAGILEFNQFLALDQQYPRSLAEKHFQKAQTGVQLQGAHNGTRQKFTFRTGPNTRMVHLVFFLEGEVARDPVVVDDIEITAVKPNEGANRTGH